MDAPKAGLRQRMFAWALARFNHGYEEFIAKYKHALFSGLKGTIIEIGPGTGANLGYLNPLDVRWIGIEPNPFMQKYLEQEAERKKIDVEIRTGTADRLPAEENSADAVISTLVLCCVHSQQESLREILRVLRPGGRLLFIEHVAGARGSRLRRIQNLVTPLWKRLGDGCHPNRETWIALENAGFEHVSYERITGPIPLASPQIVGQAIKAA